MNTNHAHGRPLRCAHIRHASAVILLSIVMLALLSLAALAIDISMVVNARRELNTAADHTRR